MAKLGTAEGQMIYALGIEVWLANVVVVSDKKGNGEAHGNEVTARLAVSDAPTLSCYESHSRVEAIQDKSCEVGPCWGPIAHVLGDLSRGIPGPLGVGEFHVRSRGQGCRSLDRSLQAAGSLSPHVFSPCTQCRRDGERGHVDSTFEFRERRVEGTAGVGKDRIEVSLVCTARLKFIRSGIL